MVRWGRHVRAPNFTLKLRGHLLFFDHPVSSPEPGNGRGARGTVGSNPRVPGTPGSKRGGLTDLERSPPLLRPSELSPPTPWPPSFFSVSSRPQNRGRRGVAGRTVCTHLRVPWTPGSERGDLADTRRLKAGFVVPQHFHLQFRGHLPFFLSRRLVQRTGDRLGSEGDGVYAPRVPGTSWPKC